MIPKPVKIISSLGIIPFFCGAMASLDITFIFTPYNDFIVGFSLVYAALILSFIGGCIFAFETISFQSRNNTRIFLSILPTVWALISVNLPYLKASSLALGFLLVFELERRISNINQAPSWWVSLRFPLTVCVIAMLAIIGFHD